MHGNWIITQAARKEANIKNHIKRQKFFKKVGRCQERGHLPIAVLGQGYGKPDHLLFSKWLFI